VKGKARRTTTVEDTFDLIVSKVLVAMAAVKASTAEYQAGLRYLREEATTALRASEETDSPAWKEAEPDDE
jgi:hypothetical protein